jgi:hypothetical protein
MQMHERLHADYDRIGYPVDRASPAGERIWVEVISRILGDRTWIIGYIAFGEHDNSQRRQRGQA